jgi:lipid-binding SYLF domain-containing protein
MLAGGCAAARTEASAPAEARAENRNERQTHAAAVVADSARALRELRKSTPQQVLDYALTDARAVIVMPGVYQAGFIYSLRGGEGVLVARRADGGWSAPALMSLGGAGFGYQAGVEKARLVLVISDDAMLERILDCGLDLSAGAGFDILGVRQDTTLSNLTEKRPVLAFSDGAGIMAGVAVKGGLLSVNEGLTRAYHGAQAGDSAAVLKGADAPGLETFELWAALTGGLPPKGQRRIIRP